VNRAYFAGLGLKMTQGEIAAKKSKRIMVVEESGIGKKKRKAITGTQNKIQRRKGEDFISQGDLNSKRLSFCLTK